MSSTAYNSKKNSNFSINYYSESIQIQLITYFIKNKGTIIYFAKKSISNIMYEYDVLYDIFRFFISLVSVHL